MIDSNLKSLATDSFVSMNFIRTVTKPNNFTEMVIRIPYQINLCCFVLNCLRVNFIVEFQNRMDWQQWIVKSVLA